MNKMGEKAKREYFRDPLKKAKVKQKPPKKNYYRMNCRIPEPRIKDVKNYVEEIKNHSVKNLITPKINRPIDFPFAEFNKRLEGIIKNNPSEISEKKLKDILVWEIIDKKESLEPIEMYNLYFNSKLERTIENVMKGKDYLFDEERGVFYLIGKRKQ